MRFNGGYLGACIIVLSLLLGTGLGLLTNVESVAQTTTKYDYVTDISGLFDYSDVPQYIDYNPVSNYTGYTNLAEGTALDPKVNPTGISYTKSVSASNYRVPAVLGGTEVSTSGTLNQASVYDQIVQLRTRGYIEIPLSDDMVTYGDTRAYITGFKMCYFSTFLTSVYGDLDDYQSLVLTMSYPVHAPIQRAGLVTGYGPADVPLQTGKDYSLYVQYPETITIDCVNGTFTMSGGWSVENRAYSIYNTYLYYGDCVQTERTQPPGSSVTINTYNTSTSLTYTSTSTEPTVYDYLVPSMGVYCVRVPNSTYQCNKSLWDNDVSGMDYKNVRIDILVGPRIVDGIKDSEYWYNTLFIYTYDDNNHYDRYAIQLLGIDAGARVYRESGNVGYSPSYSTVVTLGKFDALMLSFYEDKVDIYPVIEFTDYFNVVVAPEPQKTIESYYGTDLDHLAFWSNTGDSLAWSVYNTKVFMDTYNSVMVDPSIDLSKYWGDMTSYRYAFQSFAIYGDSVTINGVTYPITDGKITINNKTYDFKNLYLSFSTDDRTSITFRDINKTVDLGDTVDKVVSFEGVWYFSTGLYEGKETTEEVYNWDLTNIFDNINLNQFALISLGLMAVLCLVSVGLRLSFKLMDKVVLLFGALFMLLLIGGL